MVPPIGLLGHNTRWIFAYQGLNGSWSAGIPVSQLAGPRFGSAKWQFQSQSRPPKIAGVAACLRLLLSSGIAGNNRRILQKHSSTL
jgi:hypothetical protein